jgi:hypothetical protein
VADSNHPPEYKKLRDILFRIQKGRGIDVKASAADPSVFFYATFLSSLFKPVNFSYNKNKIPLRKGLLITLRHVVYSQT